MSLIVQKFGGTSVADSGRLRHVAQIITDTYKAGNQVVAVLSAQGDTTDELIEKAREINPGASTREMDMLLSTGEQISVALCAMAVEALGFPVVSLTGWQAGVVTNTVSMNARIKKVDTERIEAELDARRSTAMTTSPPWGGADRTPRPWPWLRPCTRISARFTPMWTAFTPRTRGWCPTPGSWTRLHTMKC